MLRPLHRIAATACLLAACGGGSDLESSDAAAPGDMMDGGAAATAMAPITSPVHLSDSDMERFVAVIADMKTLGGEYADMKDAGELGNMGAGWAASAEAMAILRQHGFEDVMAFQRISFSVGSAMAAAEMEGRSAEIEASRARMEQMKSSMSEEQYNMMMQSQEQSMGMITNQPDGNVELVRAWRDRIEAATQD